MKKLTLFQIICLWLAGYDRRTAEQCTTSEVQKMTIAGTMVAIPALVGLFSYGYAFYFVFDSMTAAKVGGLVSAILLLLIDRGIMAYGRPGRFSIGMLGRGVLALTVGLLLAEPLVLKIFEDSILEQQYDELETKRVIAARPFDIEIASLEAALYGMGENVEQLREAYTIEMDGTGGSGVPNKGPIYQQKYNDFLDFQKDYALKAITINSQVLAVRQRKMDGLAALTSANGDKLLGRMRALDALGQTEPIVQISTWLLRLFFTLIELLPLLIKISPSGDRGLYYRIVDISDLEQEGVLRAVSADRQQSLIKGEEIRYTRQYLELCQNELQIIAESKGKDTVYLMEKVASMAEMKIDLKHRAAKKIPDEALLERIYNQIDTIFDGFVQILTGLNERSNGNYAPDKV